MPRRTVVITGASTGIGRATALRLDADGWGVYAGVRTAEAAAELTHAGSPRLQPVLLDVTVPEQIAEVATRLESELGTQGLGALVNNAGIPIGGPLDYLPLDDLRRVFEVNTFAPIAMVQALRDPLRRAKGRVVMISSISSRIAAPNMGPYAASKSALSALSEALRAELRPSGIKVAVVEPGAVATPIWEKASEYGGELRSTLPPEALEHHEKAMARSEASLAARKSHSIEADEVAKVVEKALNARSPRARYVVGSRARNAATFVRLAPDRLRNRVVRRR